MAELIDLSILHGEPSVTGSVQEFFSLSHKGESCFLARTSDSGSLFDFGSFFSIAGSGVARNTFRHHVFSRLGDPQTWQSLTDQDFAACFSEPSNIDSLRDSSTMDRFLNDGASTHHLGIVDSESGELLSSPNVVTSSNLVLIRKFPVLKPGQANFNGKSIYDYHDYFVADRKVIALEHVVRLGVPGGSSIYDRYQRMISHESKEVSGFLAAYGLTEPLEPWTTTPNLVCDWATKYEDYDRHLSLQEASLISSLSGYQLENMVDLLKLCTVVVERLCRNAGLRLWDLKWELAVENGELVVVDAIDHDSTRITKRVDYDGHSCHVHFNKQAIRDYYRIFHSEWHESLGDAKRRANAAADGNGFVSIYASGVESGRYPAIPELDPEFASIQASKYSVANELITDQVGTDAAEKLAVLELNYYQSRGHLEDFLRRNLDRSGQSH